MSESRKTTRFLPRLLTLSLGMILTASAVAAPASASGYPDCESTSEQVLIGSVTHMVETISKVGVCTWSVPDNVSSVDIRLVAGGGGGGGGDSTMNGRSGGGGGAGGSVDDALKVEVDAGATINFSIGAGGTFGVGSLADGTLGTNGAVGGNSSYSVSSPDLFGFVSGGAGGTAASRGDGEAGVAGDGANYSVTLSGALGSLRQGGSGGSSQSTGSLSSDVNLGLSHSGFSELAMVLSSGGGGGDLAQFGSTGVQPGSGGGGGRGSLGTPSENSGFNGLAGRDGLVMVRYVVEQTTPAIAPGVPTEVPVDLVVQATAKAGSVAMVTGDSLGAIAQIKVGGEVVGFEIIGSNAVFSIPNLAHGTYLVELLTADDELLLQTGIEIIGSASSEVDRKVNAGSFKGYVAVYAKGYEGHRLSAKVGSDWVIVPVIENNHQSGTLFRAVDYTGPGVSIAVRIYIDRSLVETVNLVTK